MITMKMKSKAMFVLALATALPASTPALAQYVPGKRTTPAASAPAVESDSRKALAGLEWLAGCWKGKVNQREFREHWLPMAGGMMVGAGHTVLQDTTEDYDYLRLEARDDGVYYVNLPSGQKETAFKLTGTAADDKEGAQSFTFTNATDTFPKRIVYRRGSEGWLYASIEGTIDGKERKVTYPMRRVSCESGEILRN
jgi:hypothetical protein